MKSFALVCLLTMTSTQADVIVSADFTNRTVVGPVASNIAWTVKGVTPPSGTMEVVNTSLVAGDGTLFSTTDATGYFAVANNVGNGGLWETSVDFSTGSDAIELDDLSLSWGMFSNSGDLQPIDRNATYTIDILDASEASVLEEAPSQELIGITGVNSFAVPVTLSRNTTYTLLIQASQGAISGNNTGFSGFTLNGSIAMQVILQGGQSNALGRAPSSGLSTTPIDLQAVQTNVRFFYDSPDNPGTGLTLLQPGSGKSTTEFGPEVTFGRTLADAEPDTNYAIIKYAHGGTALYNDWAPGTGAQYLSFQTTVANGLSALQAAGYTTEIAGMIWHQGESDALEGQQASYQANLTAFIADIRSNYGSDLPFVMGEIRRSNGPAHVTVADAALAVANSDPLSAFVTTNDLSFLDTFHFDASSQETMGERYANSFMLLTAESLAVLSISNDVAGAIVELDEAITYTVTFNADVDESTVSADDFVNAGTAAVTIGSVSEDSPGVFSLMVTPTSKGSVILQLPTTATILSALGEALEVNPALTDAVTLQVNEFIPGVTIEDFSSEFGNGLRPPENVINGNGFDESTGFHSAAGGDNINWINLLDSDLPTITFDLEGNYNLDDLRIWNWNTTNTLTAGVNEFTLSVADSEGGSFTELGSFTLAQAPGSASIDFGESFDLSSFPAASDVRLVRLEVISSHGFDFNLAGLSEVRFSGDLNTAADDYLAYISNPAFGLSSSEQGLTDDPDGDGVVNGLEAYFGTDPSVGSSGFEVSIDGGNVVLIHPQSGTVPVDLLMSYEWSLNLLDWFAGDGVDGPGNGLGVTLTSSDTEPENQIDVLPSSGIEKIFFRASVTQDE